MRGARGLNPLWSAPVAGLLAVAMLPVSAQAITPVRFAGMLSGMVADSSGKPQTGALVSLFNKQDHLLQRAATDTAGTFSFEDLLPDIYSIRITLTSFVPAVRDRVQVHAGMRSLLEVNLSRVFSSIQLVSTVPLPGGLMNEDWKWAVRSDPSLRPILRFLPQLNAKNSGAGQSGERSAIFTGSRGLVRISASDGAQAQGSTGEADLGTQFAFATSVYGGNHVKVSGNVGYASASGTPAAAIRTTYSRDFLGATPAVSVTMRQLFVPFRVGQSLTGSPTGDGPLPSLRTLSVSFGDKTQLSDSMTAEYGFELDSIAFLDHIHYFSPYAKLSHTLGNGSLDLTWTSGNARPELGMNSKDQNADLQRDLTSLAVLPRLTLENSRVKVQRGDDYEISVSQRVGSREYRASVYREDISNTSLTIANPEAGLFNGDLLPDLLTSSALFNAGHFQTTGYLASVTQDLGQNFKVAATYGTIGVIDLREGSLPVANGDDLRRLIESGSRRAITVRTYGTVRKTGTRFVASYQWADLRSALPAPLLSTQSPRPDPGFNVVLRQPLPSFGMPWRLEASAELRNLLAQGYLPVAMADGRQLLLVNTPRSVRGGLAFVF